jgi:serine phosphatase RsbU (regulator of sigma subunit)
MVIKDHINKEEILKYITVIFPFIDLPFGILCVILSENWIFTLCFLPVFHLTAMTMIFLSKKWNSKNPGAYIFFANGIFYFIFQYISGTSSPGWGMLINVTIGASFMFNSPRVGQFLVAGMGILTGSYFYFLGASWEYSILIILTLVSITALFSRTYGYLQIQQSNIEKKNEEIETKNKDITDSINYSKRIQLAVLPNEEYIQRSIPLFFILYQPKDIVSGDFYWFHEINRDEYILVCADCTGHGVPGAFMTVIGSNLLTHIISENKITSPTEILKQLDLRITETLKQDRAKEFHVQDGMDLSLIKVNKSKKEFTYCSAKRPAILFRNNELIEIKANKFSLGGMRTDEKKFVEQVIPYLEDDLLYLFTDGFIDQFGGDQYKKFMISRFRELVKQNAGLPINQQKEKFDAAINDWKGQHEQTDDILLMGIKF